MKTIHPLEQAAQYTPDYFGPNGTVRQINHFLLGEFMWALWPNISGEELGRTTGMFLFELADCYENNFYITIVFNSLVSIVDSLVTIFQSSF